MISTSERVKALKGFQPIYVKELKLKGKNYDLGFHPDLGLFRVIPIDEEPSEASFAISTQNLFSKGKVVKPLSKFDWAERMAWKAKLAWKSLTAKRRNEIIDAMPLNSLYLSGDTI
jgi:hypothetical protein